MNIVLRFVLILFLLTSLSYPQELQNWKWSHPLPQGNYLKWVKMWDNNNWYAAGLGGTFMKTSDAGATWFVQHHAGNMFHTGYSSGIFNAYFKNMDSGLTVGDNGVQFTTDGGNKFYPIPNPVPTGQTYYGIYFSTPDLGYLCGPYLYKTSDGGMSWTQNPALSSWVYYDVVTPDDNLILIASIQAKVYRSTDGGETFTMINTGAVSNSTLYKVRMKSPTEYYVCGSNSTLRRSTDAGETWTNIGTGLPSGDTFYDVDFRGDTTYVTGDPFNIYYTGNNGATWGSIRIVADPPQQTLTNYYYNSDFLADRFVTVGSYGLINEKIGNNAPVVFTNVLKTGIIIDVWASKSGKVITVGGPSVPGSIYDQVMISTNAGTTWTAGVLNNSPVLNPTSVMFAPDNHEGLSSSQDLPLVTQETFRSLDMVDSLHGFTGGTGGAVYKTTDGGFTWSALTFLPSNVTIFDLSFVNLTTGWAFGYPGAIYKTTDGGQSWINQSIVGLTGYIYSGSMWDAQHGWFAAQQGYIGHTTDGGTSWEFQLNNPFGSNALYCIKAFSQTTAMVGGAVGSLGKTNDGGNTWTSIATVPEWSGTTGLTAMAWADTLTGIIGGSLGRIAYTTDGGQNWDVEYNGLNTINGIAIAEGYGNRPAYCTSVNGMIQKYADFMLPVELNSFTAKVKGNKVLLSWNTATEINNRGYSVERKVEGKQFTEIAFVNGKGTTTEPQSYSYSDILSAGKYTYRLKQVDFDGTVTYSKEVNAEIAAPLAYELTQNYPNPFNPATTIRYSVPKDGFVKLTIYNALGQKLTDLVNGYVTAGSYDVNFNSSQYTSGVYFYKLEAGNYVKTMKMTILK